MSLFRSNYTEIFRELLPNITDFYVTNRTKQYHFFFQIWADFKSLSIAIIAECLFASRLDFFKSKKLTNRLYQDIFPVITVISLPFNIIFRFRNLNSWHTKSNIFTFNVKLLKNYIPVHWKILPKIFLSRKFQYTHLVQLQVSKLFSRFSSMAGHPDRVEIISKTLKRILSN